MLGMVVGWFIVVLPFWRPSCVASMDCNVWFSCVVFVSMCICVLKSLAGLFPRSMLRIGHLPPLHISRRSCRSFVVSRDSDFCIVFASSQEVCVGEGLVTLFA